MEIHALRLILTEQDLHRLAMQEAKAGEGVRDLRVRVQADGVYVTGVYPTSFLDVPFVTVWHPYVQGGRLAARLSRLQTGNGTGDLAMEVFGLISPGAARGTVMNAIARAVQGEDSISVEGETVLVDPDRLAARRGWTLRSNLTAVHCRQGSLLIEAATTL